MINHKVIVTTTGKKLVVGGGEGEICKIRLCCGHLFTMYCDYISLDFLFILFVCVGMFSANVFAKNECFKR